MYMSECCPLDENVAEIIGIHVGDGSLSLDKRKNRITYRALYSGHPTNDRAYFKEYLANLWLSVFDKPLKIKRASDGTIRAVCNSKNIFYTLSRLGMPIGPKKGIVVPLWVVSNEEFYVPFLRGLFDSDGSFFLRKKHKKYYYYPSLKISSKSRKLINDVYDMLVKLGFKCCKSTFSNKRYGKKSEISEVYLNGSDSVGRWFKEIGSSNPRTLVRWKKYITSTNSRKPR